MTMQIKQLIVTEQEDEKHMYTILTEDNRMFVGGIHSNQWAWMEIPPPTAENTKFHGESPFPDQPKTTYDMSTKTEIPTS